MKIKTTRFEYMIKSTDDELVKIAWEEVTKLAEAVNGIIAEEPLCIWCKNKITEIRNNGNLKYVYCGRCGASGPYENSKEEAIDKWNERSK